MRYSELARQLRKLGCELYRQGAGSHEVWWNPHTKRRTVIARHPSREIPKGTLNGILRDLGIEPDAFWQHRK
jgi:predicted RNA binding protein YcfA (HicA-like mRNA interferase family)